MSLVEKLSNSIDLPFNWRLVKISEVLTLGSGKDYKHLNKGKIPVYGTGGYMTSVDEFLYDGESVGIGRKGTIDKPVFLTGKFWTVDTLFYTHSFKDIIPYFTYLVFQSINWRKYSEATGVPSLSKNIIEPIKIFLPPLPEQQKIAEILSTVDEKIELIDQQITETQELKKGLMQRLLTKGIGHTKFKDSPLGEIPESWEVVKFENILMEERGSLGYGILQPGTGVENGINMVRTVDLTENGRANTKILKVPQVVSDTSPTTVLRGGEILLSVMGTLGRTFVVPKEWAGWNVNRALAVIRTKDIMDNHFLGHFFRSPYFKRVIERQSIGSAQLRINLNDLRKYEIPLPSLEEQIEISKRLNLIDDKLVVLNEKCSLQKELKQGLMQQLLTGKIRVKA